mmetsp:Transcript_24657/g.85090  ORF Transcript_24657/g.85090 Transcript_24657/m.85090 type:complete len:484 (-) Transcript_24657:1586-3037(-)
MVVHSRKRVRRCCSCCFIVTRVDRVLWRRGRQPSVAGSGSADQQGGFPRFGERRFRRLYALGARRVPRRKRHREPHRRVWVPGVPHRGLYVLRPAQGRPGRRLLHGLGAGDVRLCHEVEDSAVFGVVLYILDGPRHGVDARLYEPARIHLARDHRGHALRELLHRLGDGRGAPRQGARRASSRGAPRRRPRSQSAHSRHRRLRRAGRIRALARRRDDQRRRAGARRRRGPRRRGGLRRRRAAGPGLLRGAVLHRGRPGAVPPRRGRRRLVDARRARGYLHVHHQDLGRTAAGLPRGPHPARGPDRRVRHERGLHGRAIVPRALVRRGRRDEAVAGRCTDACSRLHRRRRGHERRAGRLGGDVLPRLPRHVDRNQKVHHQARPVPRLGEHGPRPRRGFAPRLRGRRPVRGHLFQQDVRLRLDRLRPFAPRVGRGGMLALRAVLLDGHRRGAAGAGAVRARSRAERRRPVASLRAHALDLRRRDL